MQHPCQTGPATTNTPTLPPTTTTLTRHHAYSDRPRNASRRLHEMRPDVDHHTHTVLCIKTLWDQPSNANVTDIDHSDLLATTDVSSPSKRAANHHGASLTGWWKRMSTLKRVLCVLWLIVNACSLWNLASYLWSCTSTTQPSSPQLAVQHLQADTAQLINHTDTTILSHNTAASISDTISSPTITTTSSPASLGDRLPSIIGRKVDVVYSWVNGSAPLHIQTMAKYAATAGNLGKDNGNNRYRSDIDELRFSLRSLEMYMNWINHVYIVCADGQEPVWLDQSYDRVTVVRHSQIFSDLSNLPTFSSIAIESQIHHIPGLSDDFIYLNDDMLLIKPYLPEDMQITTKNDNGEVTTLHAVYNDGILTPCRHDTADQKCRTRGSITGHTVQNVDNLLYEWHGDPRIRYPLAHSPHLIHKPLMLQMERTFEPQFRLTASHRFRHPDDTQMITLYTNYLMEIGYGYQLMEWGHSFLMLKDGMLNALAKELDRTFNLSPSKVACINDDLIGTRSTPIIQSRVHEYLSTRYPTPSKFELSS